MTSFVLHDTGPEKDNEEEDHSTRVIVFSTRRNIEFLCKLHTWFVDGTFKVAPTVFMQVFTVLGLVQRNRPSSEPCALPLVYALLPGKTTEMYTEVLRAVRRAVERYRINACVPLKIISDFELAIMRACRDVYPGVPVTGCFFHLGQSLYRRIQDEGLATRYRDPDDRYQDPDDRTIRNFTHMTFALAFVSLRMSGLHSSCSVMRVLPTTYQCFNISEIHTSWHKRRNRRCPTLPT